MPQQNDDLTERKLLGRALAALREAKGLSQAQAGAAFGTSGQNWAKYENGNSPTIFRPDVQRRLTRAVGKEVLDLMAERARLAGEPLSTRPMAAGVSERPANFDAWVGMEIRDRIQAAWSYGAGESGHGSYPAGPDPRYPVADQWLDEVVDDSAEGLGILRHDLVKIVAAEDIGYYPRTGDIVLVERLREGAERELTLRQVEVGPAGVHLWLRGPAPRATPVKLPAIGEAVPGAPRIAGLVAASIRRY